MAPRGKYNVGFCSYCGRDISLRKKDQKAWRHPSPTDKYRQCPGTGEYPSMIVNADESITEFIPIIVRDKPVEVYVEKDELEIDPVTGKNHAVSTMTRIEYDNGVLGREFPVYTEAGTVIGRARVEVGRIVILGPKWSQRPA